MAGHVLGGEDQELVLELCFPRRNHTFLNMQFASKKHTFLNRGCVEFCKRYAQLLCHVQVQKKRLHNAHVQKVFHMCVVQNVLKLYILGLIPCTSCGPDERDSSDSWHDLTWKTALNGKGREALLYFFLFRIVYVIYQSPKH